MRFGVFDHIEPVPGLSLDRIYRERLQQIERLDAAGFHAYHLAEHHTPAIHSLAPSQNVFLGAGKAARRVDRDERMLRAPERFEAQRFGRAGHGSDVDLVGGQRHRDSDVHEEAPFRGVYCPRFDSTGGERAWH